MKRISAFLKDLLFVPRCAVCGREPQEEDGRLLCRACRNRYEFEEKTLCRVCQKTYDRCDCRPQFASPFVGNYRRVAYYREERVSGRLILAAKDCTDRRLTAFLADRMVSVCQEGGFSPEVVTYIPCSGESYRRKGFDHGRVLAQAVAKRLSLPCVGCFKRKKGAEQKQLDAKARLENSKASLLVQKDVRQKVQGKRVLLVDDIMTTGASSLVASVHLDELGAQSVDFICFGSR